MVKRFWLVAALLLLVAVAPLPLPISASPRQVPRLFPTPLQHIVFIVKENHTFDHYFGEFPGANGATTGKVKVGGTVYTIPLQKFQDMTDTDFPHSWSAAHTAFDNGAMDAFNTGTCNAFPYRCYQVASQSDLPNYWALASNYLLNDNTFSDLEGPSFPNHMFTVAAASGPDTPHSAISNPANHDNSTQSAWGCDSPSDALVTLYDGEKQYPCFTGVDTLVDEMDAAGVTWKYYAPQQGEPGYRWNVLDAFTQIRNGSGWSNDVAWDSFTADAMNGDLPEFSWLIAPDTYSEHPPASTCLGENWTIAQINAVMSGPDWDSTAIIITWDDYGGFYDHVAPQSVDSLGYGFRVPLLIVSPYAYATDNPANRHISHLALGFSSVIKLAEQAFGLPSLNRRDAIAGDMTGEFDFAQTHNPAALLSARVCNGMDVYLPLIMR